MTCHLVRCDSFLIFSAADPRTDGCMETIQDEVWLDDAGLGDGSWPSGLCVGRNPTDESHYRLFKCAADRSRAGFRQVAGLPVVVLSWDGFLRTVMECHEAVS